MHNNDPITGGVGIVLGRLDAKHTFIICNLSFRGAEEKKKQMVRGDWETATKKPDTVRNWNQSESFQAWPHIQPYVASALSAHSRLQGAWKVTFSKTKYVQKDQALAVFFLNLCCFLRLGFQGFSLLSRFQCEVVSVKEQYSCFYLIIGWLFGLGIALKKAHLRVLGLFVCFSPEMSVVVISVQ